MLSCVLALYATVLRDTERVAAIYSDHWLCVQGVLHLNVDKCFVPNNRASTSLSWWAPKPADMVKLPTRAFLDISARHKATVINSEITHAAWSKWCSIVIESWANGHTMLFPLYCHCALNQTMGLVGLGAWQMIRNICTTWCLPVVSWCNICSTMLYDKRAYYWYTCMSSIYLRWWYLNHISKSCFLCNRA